MPREMERATVELVRKIYGGHEHATPDWLQRPGAVEAGRRWRVVQVIYTELADMTLPDIMPAREYRKVDCVLQRRGQPPRIVEFDESQHFNRYRALTLRRYPRSVRTGFNRGVWLRACDAKTRLEGGGFGRPRPPLFPHEDGRHRQRAYRDALADLLPSAHGWLPTLRIAAFEVEAWIYGRDAPARLAELLTDRLSPKPTGSR